MRFRNPITYASLTAGLVACSVYDASLKDSEVIDDGFTGSGAAAATTTDSTSSTTTNLPTTTTVSMSGSNGGTSGSGTGGNADGGTGGDAEGGTGGTPTTTSSGGDGGTDTSQVTTSSGGATTGSPTTTGSMTSGSGGNPTADPALIDDLEDGNSRLEGDYDGYWYTAGDTIDGDGMLDPEPMNESDGVTVLDEERDGSTRAMHVSGYWDGGWGAALGFSFLNPEAAIDASMFTGISFWVRTEMVGTEVKVQLLLTTVTDGADYEYLLSDEVALDGNWQQVSLAFSDFEQPTWTDDPVTFDPTKLYKIQFQFIEGQGTFDLWVDDIWFLE